jgi:hypothetical protein
MRITLCLLLAITTTIRAANSDDDATPVQPPRNIKTLRNLEAHALLMFARGSSDAAKEAAGVEVEEVEAHALLMFARGSSDGAKEAVGVEVEEVEEEEVDNAENDGGMAGNVPDASRARALGLVTPIKSTKRRHVLFTPMKSSKELRRERVLEE